MQTFGKAWLAVGCVLLLAGTLLAVDPAKQRKTPPYQINFGSLEAMSLMVGRYKIVGEYRLDTITGDVRRVADLIEPDVQEQPMPEDAT